jgi:hypothetical protein
MVYLFTIFSKLLKLLNFYRIYLFSYLFNLLFSKPQFRRLRLKTRLNWLKSALKVKKYAIFNL